MFEDSPLFATGLGATTLSALTALTTSVGFAAVFGLLFVPSPNDISTSGALPGHPEARYTYDDDTGLLRVAIDGAIRLAGHADKSGIFHDAATDRAFARLIAGSIVFDAAAIDDAREDADGDAIPRVEDLADTKREEPKLCPEHGLDQPGGTPSKEAIAYQQQIRQMVNPQKEPLAFGLAVNLLNPLSGKLVHFDDCQDSTGAMIEAKGPRLDYLSGYTIFGKDIVNDWVTQATNQVDAAGDREIDWYFAEEGAAQRARGAFARERKLKGRINIFHVRPIP